MSLTSHTTRLSRRVSGQRPNERGAAVVEFAIVASIFFFLLFSIIELSLWMRDHEALAFSTRAGARVASTTGSDPMADRQTISAVQKNLNAVPQDSIEFISIYKADTSGGSKPKLPSGCDVGPVDGVCNYYSYDQIDTIMLDSKKSTNFGCGASSYDRYFCPTDRNTEAGYDPSTGLTETQVGVYVALKHTFILSFFGTSDEMHDSATAYMEPTSIAPVS